MFNTYYNQVQNSSNGDGAYKTFLDATHQKQTTKLGGGFFHAVLSKIAQDPANENNVIRATSVFKAMKLEKVTLGPQNYNKLIKTCLKVDDYKQASFFLNNMSTSSEKTKFINEMLQKSLDTKHWDSAFKMLCLAQSNRELVDQDTQKKYNFILRAALKEGNPERAIKIHDLHFNGVFKPDLISGNQMIDHYANKGQTSNAESVYHFKKFTPDEITFNSLMKAGVIAGDKEFIHKIFLEMQKAQMSPTENMHKHCWKIVKNEWVQATEDSTRQNCQKFYSTCKKIHPFGMFLINGFQEIQAKRMEGSSTLGRDPEAQKKWKETDAWLTIAALKKEPITTDMLLKINLSLGGPGTFRSRGEEVASGGRSEYVYAPGELVKDEMETYVKWLNKWLERVDQGKANPIETAARAAQHLVSIHPFRDDNGRTSRLVMDYILQRSSLPPAAVGNDVLYGIFAFAQNGANPTTATNSVLEGIKDSYRLLKL